MSVDLEAAKTALRAGPVADLGKLLKPAGRSELEQAIARLERRGLRTRVLIAGEGEPLAPWHALWDGLGLGKQDLLLIFNGRGWQARGWELDAVQINRALLRAHRAGGTYHARRLVDALDALALATGAGGGAAAGGSGAAIPERRAEPAIPATSGTTSSIAGWLAGAAGLTAAGAIGLAIARRQRLARERARSLKEARSAAEQIFADVVLASEELPEQEGTMLREKASRLHGELGALVVSPQKALPAKEQTLTMARVGQIENELEALRSVVLQRKQKR